MATKKSESAAAVKKLKRNKKLVITLICIVLILAIALGAFYLFAPETFNRIFGIGHQGGYNDITGLNLEVHFIDVGQGDCILIELPDGKNMLIDSGSSGGGLGKDGVIAYIKGLGIKKLDYVMMTHSDTDHISYMDDIFAEFDCVDIYRPAFRCNSETDRDYGLITTQTYDKVITAAKQESAANNGRLIDAVGTLNITGTGYNMDIYALTESEYPKPNKNGEIADARMKNKVSPISVLSFGERKMVFTGDAEGDELSDNTYSRNDTESRFIAKARAAKGKIDCDLLKVGHHGSAASTSKDLLDFIDPEYCVISVGAENSYKHPTSTILDRLVGYRDVRPDNDYNGIDKLFMTSTHGTITVKVDDTNKITFNTQKDYSTAVTDAKSYEETHPETASVLYEYLFYEKYILSSTTQNARVLAA